MRDKDFLGNTKFTPGEIFDFIIASQTPFSFATITSKEYATYSIPEKNFFFRFNKYYGDDYNNILHQASEWVMKVVRTEKWDPSIYDETEKTDIFFLEINPKRILVKDNSFAGLISYKNSLPFYEIHYGLIEDYKNEPVFCWCHDGFGSSDHDMMYTDKYYLMRKSDKK